MNCRMNNYNLSGLPRGIKPLYSCLSTLSSYHGVLLPSPCKSLQCEHVLFLDSKSPYFGQTGQTDLILLEKSSNLRRASSRLTRRGTMLEETSLCQQPRGISRGQVLFLCLVLLQAVVKLLLRRQQFLRASVACSCN